jgi:Ca-activated chloride channel family protein
MLRGLAMIFALAAQPVHATTSCRADAMIVFDGSGSMGEIGLEFPRPRIADARDAMARAMPRIEQFRQIGLLIYGPGPRDGCSNVDLRFAPTANAARQIITEVDQLHPGGMTPLTTSVQAAAEALNYRTRPAKVVLVTDGNETCGGRPCALADALQAGARDLTIHVVGFKVRFDFFSWDNPEQGAAGQDTVAKCLAEKTGGTYSSTETVDELVAALNDTLGCALIGRLDQRKF